MCERCKDLTCCNRYGCTQAPVPRPTVAELLGRAFAYTTEPPQMAVPTGRLLSRREIPDRFTVASF